MKKNYISPCVTVTMFSVENIVTTSVAYTTNENTYKITPNGGDESTLAPNTALVRFTW